MVLDGCLRLLEELKVGREGWAEDASVGRSPGEAGARDHVSPTRTI